MTKLNELKQAVVDVAFEQRLNMTKIKALMKVAGVTNLHVNPLVCARCGCPQSEVNEYNSCKSCTEVMGLVEKSARIMQPASYQDDVKVHMKSGENSIRVATSMNRLGF